MVSSVPLPRTMVNACGRGRRPFGVNAPPVSYRVGGRQYVAVAAGGNALFGFATGDAIVAFALPVQD
jgi:glucose dehydrogenase